MKKQRNKKNNLKNKKILQKKNKKMINRIIL